MLEQFSVEFLQLYPQARVLAAGSEDLAGDKRRDFVARTTTGDWDAVIMTRTALARLEVTAATSDAYRSAQLDPSRPPGVDRGLTTGADPGWVRRPGAGAARPRWGGWQSGGESGAHRCANSRPIVSTSLRRSAVPRDHRTRG